MSAELGVSRERTMWAVTGVASQCRYGVHNNSFDNVLRGLYERVLYRVAGGVARLPPRPAAGVFESRGSAFRSKIWEHTKRCRRLTRDEFVDCYDGRKREVYRKAAESLAARPLNKADSFVSTFVKCEKLDFHAKPDPAPRVIQPRSPRFNVEVGRYLKRLESPLCKGIAEVWGGTTVFKGMNAGAQGVELAKAWSEFTQPVAVGFDATRFDQHVSDDALRFEHSVYLGLFPEAQRPRLKGLLDMQLRNRGYARAPEGTVKYEVSGRRMSGDINTGMGNCLLMCAMMFAFVSELGIRARLINNGDDCVLIFEKQHLRRVTQRCDRYFRDFGFVMEAEAPVYTLEEVTFCQCKPVFDGATWIMVRDPRVCVNKDLVSVLDLGVRGGAATWAHAIGSCGLAMTAGMPMMGSFYRLLLRHGRVGRAALHPWMDSGFARMAHGMARSDGVVSDAARLSFFRAFGIVPDLQTALEETWDCMSLDFSAGERVPTLPLDFYEIYYG